MLTIWCILGGAPRQEPVAVLDCEATTGVLYFGLQVWAGSFAGRCARRRATGGRPTTRCLAPNFATQETLYEELGKGILSNTLEGVSTSLPRRH